MLSCLLNLLIRVILRYSKPEILSHVVTSDRPALRTNPGPSDSVCLPWKTKIAPLFLLHCRLRCALKIGKLANVKKARKRVKAKDRSREVHWGKMEKQMNPKSEPFKDRKRWQQDLTVHIRAPQIGWEGRLLLSIQYHNHRLRKRRAKGTKSDTGQPTASQYSPKGQTLCKHTCVQGSLPGLGGAGVENIPITPGSLQPRDGRGHARQWDG